MNQRFTQVPGEAVFLRLVLEVMSNYASGIMYGLPSFTLTVNTVYLELLSLIRGTNMQQHFAEGEGGVLANAEIEACPAWYRYGDSQLNS